MNSRRKSGVGMRGNAILYRRIRPFLLVCCGGAVLLLSAVDGNAGGFALSEQSSYGQGSSYAGAAAGGSLSSLFWNPATLTQIPGIQTEIVGTGIFPYASHTPNAASTLAAFGGTNNTGIALVPAGYVSWQINRDLWFGLSANSPFGLAVSFPDAWAGRDYAENSSLSTYNITPSFAYRINNWISIGFGLQFQYAQASLMSGIGGTLGLTSTLAGDGWGYGFTAGVVVTPIPNMTVGLGYRSAINQRINGALTLPAAVGGPPISTPGSVATMLDLPDTVSLGVRYRLAPQWTALGTVEWSNWSRIGTAHVLQPNGAPATILAGIGGGNVTLPFQFSDGWFYSAGVEYQANDRLAVRSGIGFERSPVTDRVRIPLLPDNNRASLSVGSTYRVSRLLSLDFAYSHLFVSNTAISVLGGNPWFNGTVTYAGAVSSHIDILSVALKYRWEDATQMRTSNFYNK